MKVILKIAWRNLWRNKRRTAITAASVFFAVLLATVMMSLQEGVYNKMIANVAGFFTGYVQIHDAGYWEEQTFEETLAENDSLQAVLEARDDIETVLPRLTGFALAAYGELTEGAQVVGVDPQRENELTKLADRLVEGHYLQSGDQGGPHWGRLLPVGRGRSGGLADALRRC